MAERDWQAGPLWLQSVVETLLLKTELKEEDVDHSSNRNQSCRLMWLQTGALLHATRKNWLTTMQARCGPERFMVVDCCSGSPFGWDEQEEEENSRSGVVTSLERLDVLLDRVKQEEELFSGRSKKNSRLCVVIESLTPLLVRHGYEGTAQFLTRLSDETDPAILVLPVVVETVPRSVLLKLEDLCQAMLLVKGGEAEMLRQGIREKENRVRVNLPFELKSIAGTVSIEFVDASFWTDVSAAEDGTKIIVQEEITADDSASRRTGKVQLQTDEGGRKTVRNDTQLASTMQRIYIQDDDPEFADYDEEDPDDDLEL